MSEGAHKQYVAIVGPTGSGKSDFAMALAARVPAEIIVCDSIQLYRGFDIGSAKPTQAEQQSVPHHMLDLIDWNEAFDAAVYAQKAREVIAEVRSRGRLPIVVAGTGLYLRALWQDRFDLNMPKDAEVRAQIALRNNEQLYKILRRLDPERALQLHPNDRLRVGRSLEIRMITGQSFASLQNTAPSARCDALVVYLALERGLLSQRIVGRTKKMLEIGLLEEVAQLIDQGCPVAVKPMQSIGYKQAAEHLLTDRLAPQEALVEAICVATRQYAKRQKTWFNQIVPEFHLTEYEATSEVCGRIARDFQNDQFKLLN